MNPDKTEIPAAKAAAPLTAFATGDYALITGIQAGHGLRDRLLGLGLVPGAVIYIINSRHGPLTLCLGGCRIALGRGMAAHIFAIPTEDPYPHNPCAGTDTCPRKD